MVNITLQGQEYNAKLDFSVIGKIQVELSKMGLNLKLKENLKKRIQQNLQILRQAEI